MRFFARVTFICNLCFLAAVVLRFVENHNKTSNDINLALKFQPLESTIVVLGYGAIIINIFFAFCSLYWFVSKKINFIPRWIVLFNLVLLPLQVYYFFFSTF
jgi:hypothetical protein